MGLHFQVKRHLSIIVLLLLGGVVLGACGGSQQDSGASELARQHELAEARKEAAQDARQSEHIKDLERELRSMSRRGDDSATMESQTTTESPAPADAGAATAEPSLGDWPGGPGFTAILASLSTEEEAVSIQADASALGLDAGVLYSSDFSSLRPGYWVVFSGAFQDADEASARASRADELGYSDAYPRFVSP